MELVEGDILEFTKGKAAYSASDGAKAIYQGEKYTDQDGGEVISIKWVRNGDDNGQIDGGYFLSMFKKVEDVSTQKEGHIFKEIKKEKVMKVDFKGGVQRVVELLEQFNIDFEKDMLHDIKIIATRNDEDAIDEITEIMESIQTNKRYTDEGIARVEKADSLKDVLLAMRNTVFEEDEATILKAFLGVDSVTID